MKSDSTSSDMELRRLLDLAEEVQSRYDFIARRLVLYRVVQISLALAIAAISIGLLESDIDYGTAIGGAFALLGSLYIVAIEFVLVARARRLVETEQRALLEVVDLVREVEQTRAASDDWTPLERAEFRIRLSRFNV